MEKYTAVVVSNRTVATFITELVLKLDSKADFTFQAGDHVSFYIPKYRFRFKDFNVTLNFQDIWEKHGFFDLESVVDKPTHRIYSLANPPSEKLLVFNVRIAIPPQGTTSVPSGRGSSYVFGLKPGDSVVFNGPIVNPMIVSEDKELCFIGGGSGMAPLRSQIMDLLISKNSKQKISYWYGARAVADIFYKSDFKKLEEKFKNFSFKIALSEPESKDNWNGPTGFIHQVLFDNYLSLHDDPTNIDYYLCGPPPMIDAIIKMLESMKVQTNNIFYDKF